MRGPTGRPDLPADPACLCHPFPISIHMGLAPAPLLAQPLEGDLQKLSGHLGIPAGGAFPTQPHDSKWESKQRYGSETPGQ